MAGSEQIGLRGADPDLFEGAVWVLTPTSATDLESFDRLKGVVSSLGADVLVLSAADHDRLVAVVSHVPHLVAATLMNAATAGAEQDGALLRLAAGGFRDMTRVAAGSPGIWPDICAENSPAIVDALDALLGDLSAMRDRVAGQDRDGLLDVLQSASAARRNLPARVARPDHLAELRIRVPDQEGELAAITSLAADAGIGIYDIEIAHSAEGAHGVLILIVDGADADTLVAAVEAKGYRCRAEHLS
jgi:prephenate dehydrogenase